MARFETAKAVLGFLTCAVCWGLFIHLHQSRCVDGICALDGPPVGGPHDNVDIYHDPFSSGGEGEIVSAAKRIFAPLLGIPGTALFMGLLSIAESSVAPGESSVLTYTYPIWVPLLSVPLLGERLSPRKIAASL